MCLRLPFSFHDAVTAWRSFSICSLVLFVLSRVLHLVLSVLLVMLSLLRGLSHAMMLTDSFCSFAAFGLEYRFATTYSLLCLHVWLALVRLRAEGKDGKDLAQMMYDNFQEDVEIRVRGEGVKVSVSCTVACRLVAWHSACAEACMPDSIGRVLRRNAKGSLK